MNQKAMLISVFTKLERIGMIFDARNRELK